MKYLVTGCAGFIGWKVTELLLADGHTVVGVDNLNDAYDVRMKKWRLSQLQTSSNFQYNCIDICDRAAVESVFDKKLDGVINLAAHAGVRKSVENPWEFVDVNITGTLNLLDHCQKYEIKKFILASTSSLYGASNALPFSEDANTDGPLSPYAASKKGAEAICFSYHHLFHIDITVFRFFTVYGPAGRPDMAAFRFVQWISEEKPVTVYGDGKQSSRDYTYLDDIAKGVIAGLKPLGYAVINLGSDSPIVLIDTIRIIEELIGKKAILSHQPVHPADPDATWANIQKAQQLLGWRPQVSFREGIESVVDWYNENREWAKHVSTG
ncbi:NAD-dependent epimerase/dehydratase family protein [Candidatus Poribacteria bacterium]|nr:NAD-dependent epimerase/dehydratase family protein [Candidatus Poribacteria bacterium]MYI93256.1 NAD-dependent epimerase/dehydratase family protein [Candidatus Poribacteria bacterium]